MRRALAKQSPGVSLVSIADCLGHTDMRDWRHRRVACTRRTLCIGGLLAALGIASPATAGAAGADSVGPVTAQAKRVVRLLDSMGVAGKWQAHLHVDWMTGLPAGEQSPEYRGTHCSGFVDAVAARLGVDAGAPQDRLTNPSANRQEEFLRSGGGGWRSLPDGVAAQAAANRGEFVVAVLHDAPVGHAAVVRPADKSEARVLAEGPQVTQAGGHNYASAPAAVGFSFHASALTGVEYYAHPVSW
jgi:hypothetical protein